MKSTRGALMSLLLAGCVVVCGGCASPAHRIKRNPEMFGSFPSEVQENVRQGRIDVGYTKDMVLMALGTPDRQYLRKTASGSTEIWSYTTVNFPPDPYPFGSVAIVDRRGRTRYVPTWMWTTTVREEVRDRIRVELEDDKVKAIEYLK
jgi:hypothetical protein